MYRSLSALAGITEGSKHGLNPCQDIGVQRRFGSVVCAMRAARLGPGVVLDMNVVRFEDYVEGVAQHYLEVSHQAISQLAGYIINAEINSTTADVARNTVMKRLIGVSRVMEGRDGRLALGDVAPEVVGDVERVEDGRMNGGVEHASLDSHDAEYNTIVWKSQE